MDNNTLNWYERRLAAFHQAATSNPPNYDLMQTMIIVTLLKLEDFSVTRTWKPQKVGPPKPSPVCILSHGDYQLIIYDLMSKEGKCMIVELQKQVGDTWLPIGTANNMQCLLGDTVNIVLQKMAPSRGNKLYE